MYSKNKEYEDVIVAIYEFYPYLAFKLVNLIKVICAIFLHRLFFSQLLVQCNSKLHTLS